MCSILQVGVHNSDSLLVAILTCLANCPGEYSLDLFKRKVLHHFLTDWEGIESNMVSW